MLPLRRVWLAVLPLLTAGCGYVGDPLPPLANVPRPPAGLAALQRGARIIVQFQVPERTTEDVALKGPLQLDLRAGSAVVAPFDADSWASQAQAIPQQTVAETTARYELPVTSWVGKSVTIGARVTAANGKQSDWSNFVSLPIVAPPATPASVRAEATPAGVRLTWEGPPGQFRIFRRAGDEKAVTPVARVQQPEWLDPQTEFNKPYAYLVQRVVALGGNREAESELPPEVAITPRDTFPPAAPAGLRAAAAPQSIELYWDRSGEPDLAGYRVYRAAPGAGFERITESTQVPGFSDRTAESGKRYRYVVTAFDLAGNESSRSSAAEAARP